MGGATAKTEPKLDMADLLMGNATQDQDKQKGNAGRQGQAQVDSSAEPGSTKHTATTLTDATDQLVYTNIVAAQNQLDELLAKVKANPKKPPPSSDLDHKVLMALFFLEEAKVSAFRASAKSELITAAMSSCSSAVADVGQSLLLMDEDVARSPLRHLGDLSKHEQSLAKQFGSKASATAHVSTLKKGLDGNLPEVEAVKASLKLTELEGKRGFQMLADSPELDKGGSDLGRASAIQSTTQLTEGHLRHVVGILPHFTPDQLSAVKPSVEAVSVHFLRMKRWMDGRTGKAGMIKAFTPSIQALNQVRLYFALDAMDMDATSNFPEREEMEEKDEDKSMEAAKSDFATAWTNLHLAMDGGVDDWFTLAQAKDQKKPSLLNTLLSAAVEFAAGKLGTMVVGTLVKNLFLKEAESEKVKGLLESGVEKLKGQAAGAIGLGEGAAESDVNLKALVAMRGGLKAIHRDLHTTVGTDFEAKVKAGEIGVAGVRALTAAANKTSAQAVEKQKVVSATEWIRYVARAGLSDAGVSQAATPSSKTTGLDGYFGHMSEASYGKGAHAAERVGSKQGSAGMLRIEATDIDPIKVVPIRVTKMDLNGLNKELAEIVLADPAAITLRDVKLPKEIFFKWRIHHQRASFDDVTAKWVLDENNKVVDMIIDGKGDSGGLRADALGTILDTKVYGSSAS